MTSNDSALPWELAHDGQDFLAFKHPVGRQIMAHRSPRQSPPPQGRRWAPLLIGDPTGDLPHAIAEIKQLERLFDAVPGSAHPRVLMSRRATRAAVLEALSSGSYDLIHYAGHVAVDAQTPQSAGLVLANGELLTAADIESHLTGQPFVFLNACRSAAGMPAETAEEPVYLGHGAEGLTAAFIHGGALAVAGSLWPIHDGISSTLAVTFYRQALRGAVLGEALRVARKEGRDLAPHDPLWAAVVLYGDPSLRLAVKQQAHGWPATVLAFHLREIDTLFEQEPAKAADLIAQWVAILSSQIAKYGGDVAGLAHDLLVATFGVSSTRENDVEQGVRAALAAQDSLSSHAALSPQTLLRLGIGIGSGTIFVSQRDDSASTHNAAGAAVGEACKLARQAADGQILLDAPAERLARQIALTMPVDPGLFSATGNPLRYRLIGLLPEAQAPGSDLSLFGRSQEIEALAEVWRRCLLGMGQLVSVVGEAGIGKSRLLHEFRIALRGQEAAWFQVACSDVYQPASHALIADLLRGVFGIERAATVPETQARLRAVFQDLSGIGWSEQTALDNLGVIGEVLAVPFSEISLAHLDLPKRRQRLLLVLEHLLAQISTSRPVIITIEDLHWADAASLDLLNRLVAGIGGRSLLVLTLFRSEDGWRPPWSDRANHRRVHLGALDDRASRSLLAALLEVEEAPDEIAQAVLTQAGGNPFFLRQLVSALQESRVITRQAGEWSFSRPVDSVEVPATVQRVLLSRFQRLTVAVRNVLSIAAVAGDQVQRAVLEAFAGGTSEEIELGEGLDQLVDREFLYRPLGEDVYRFTHALVRATAYASLPSDERRRYHHRYGRALLQVYASRQDEVAELLAHHFYRSVTEPGDSEVIVVDADQDDLDQATTYLMRAGDAVNQRFAPRESIASYEKALFVAAHLVRNCDDLRTRCHEALGDAHSLLGEFEPAFSHYQAALALLSADTAHAADLSWKIARIFERQAHFEPAIAWLEQGLALLDETSEAAIYARIAIYYGMIRIRQGRLVDALTWAEKSMVDETAQAHNLMAIALRAQGQREEARDHCLRSVELAGQAGDLVGLAKANTNLGVVLFELGQWQEALQADEKALKLQADVGDAYMHAMTTCNLSDVHRHLGNLEVAIDYAQQGLREYEALGGDFGQALAHLNWGLALLTLGEPQQARVEHLEVARRLMEDHQIHDLRAQVLWSIAECLLHEGRLQEAQQDAEQALVVAVDQGSASDQGIARRVLGSILAGQGQREQAEAMYEQSLQLLQEDTSSYQRGRTLLAQAAFYETDEVQHGHPQRPAAGRRDREFVEQRRDGCE